VNLSVLVFKAVACSVAFERLVSIMPKYCFWYGCINSDTAMTEYTTVRLPKGLIKQVDDVVKDNDWGYTSRAELVKEAVRFYLETKRQPKA
jgi:hypothetical protein